MGRHRHRERHDHYYRMAKHEGYRTRASFKLKQLNSRFGILKRGDIVVDLGAAPGGWVQVAREEVGDEGFVLGVDMQQVAKFPYKNVRVIVADITDVSAPELIRQNLPREPTVILSDASPKISGVWNVDHFRSIELARAALRIADQILQRGGKLLVKIFQGDMFDEFVKELREKFESVKISKPLASRKNSAETYIICKGFKGL
ncbi:MAG: 23S rRNA (uridine(2552)-2'-O)-methyltransferase [Hadesarchaea archaeon]|nr:MAG: 23S rRNA (uridine(2552)-2'-O)-methyltransferase [Hadesarchaea archaeon]HDI12654.1 RlmE family RNA methyltransferase [Hadesarchaea archaeon]